MTLHRSGDRERRVFWRLATVARTVAFRVAAADHEDSRFVPSNEGGIWRRTRHAVVGTFVSRTRNGGTMLAVSRFNRGNGAAFIANAWEPPSQHVARSGTGFDRPVVERRVIFFGRPARIVRIVVLSLFIVIPGHAELKKAVWNKASKANSKPRMGNRSNSRLRRCFRNITEVCSRMD